MPTTEGDAVSQEWETDNLPALVGNKETCELLGIQKSTLARWMKPETGEHGPQRTYMIEWKTVNAGPVWDRRDVEDFAAMNPRRRARPKQ
jgi:hypothetical protein